MSVQTPANWLLTKEFSNNFCIIFLSLIDLPFYEVVLMNDRWIYSDLFQHVFPCETTSLSCKCLCKSVRHQTYIIQSITLYIHNTIIPGQKRTGTSQKCKSQYSKELQDKQQVKHKKLSQIAYRMDRCWYTTGRKKTALVYVKSGNN